MAGEDDIEDFMRGLDREGITDFDDHTGELDDDDLALLAPRRKSAPPTDTPKKRKRK
jgi:hypothetical protein